MKKIIAVFISLSLILAFTACSSFIGVPPKDDGAVPEGSESSETDGSTDGKDDTPLLEDEPESDGNKDEAPAVPEEDIAEKDETPSSEFLSRFGLSEEDLYLPDSSRLTVNVGKDSGEEKGVNVYSSVTHDSGARENWARKIIGRFAAIADNGELYEYPSGEPLVLDDMNFGVDGFKINGSFNYEGKTAVFTLSYPGGLDDGENSSPSGVLNIVWEE